MSLVVIFIIFLSVANKGYCLKPNIVLVLTDDQDLLLKGLKPMRQTTKMIGIKGVIFENAFVNTPLCCPSRSTILTGKYLHNTGVRNNSLSGNCSSICWQRIHEPFTIGPILKSEKQYVTFYAGKYLNQYGSKEAGGTEHVPNGYDWWIGLKGNSVYYNYTLSINGSSRYFSNKYLTDLLKEYTLSFLNQKVIKTKPFFMMISPPAPHQPFTPAPRHQNAFPGTRAIRTPSFNATSDKKHWLLTMSPRFLPENVTLLDNFQKLRWQSLMSVDELMENLIYKLNNVGVLQNTYIIFTSDNGYHLGQFSQPYDKRQPYETDIRVPLMIRGPNIKRKVVVNQPVATVDLAPTILEMAGIDQENYKMDGESFLEHITTENYSFERSKRKNVFVEYFGEVNDGNGHSGCDYITDPNVSHCASDAWCKCSDSLNNTYVCVRTISQVENFKFCRFLDDQNFFEAYDLRNDVSELNNIFSTMEESKIEHYKNLLNKFVMCQGKSCRTHLGV